MKRFLLALSVLLTISLSGCGHHQAAASSEETIYHSDTSAGDCLLCGEGTEASYWGQENVALISLNTFEIKPIEINRYDRLNGQLIEEYAGVISFGGGGSQYGGFSAAMLLEYDRGYATGSLHFYDDEVLDADRAVSFLCADCMNRILPKNLERCFGVGVIHLATKELRMFEKNGGGFGLGDFHIDYHVEGEKCDSLWLDILIFYCPVRYGNEP